MSGQAKVTLVLEAVDRAQSTIQRVKREVASLSSHVQTSAQRMAVAASTAQAQVQRSTESLLRSVKGLASGFSGLATSLWGFYTVYDRIGTQQRQLASLQATYNTTLATYHRLQLTLNQAIAKYGENSEQARLARERLAAVEERLRVYQIQIAEYQANINETLVQGAVMAFPLAINAVSGLTAAKQALAAVSLSRVIPAIRAVGVSLKAALGPIGLAIAAVGLLYTAWTQNWGGIQEKTRAAVEAVVNALRRLWDLAKPILEPLLAIFQRLGEMVGAILPGRVEASTQALASLTLEAASASRSLEELKSSGLEAALSLAEGWEAVTPALNLVQAELEEVKVSLQEIPPLMDEVALAAENAWDLLLQPAGQAEKVYREMAGQLQDLGSLLFEYAVKPSESFRRSLSETAEKVWVKLRTEGAQSLESLRELVKGFAEEWGLTWTQTITLLREELRKLAREAGRSMVQPQASQPPAEPVQPPKATQETAPPEVLEATEALREMGDNASWAARAIRDLGLSAESQLKAIERWAEANREMLEQTIENLKRLGVATARLSLVEAYAIEKLGLGRVTRTGEVVLAQHGGYFTQPTLALIAEREPELVIPESRLKLARAEEAAPIIHINAPLVYVAGSADRRTAELAAELVRERLQTVLVEATSSMAPTKRIRWEA
ncbi:MAG: hypothetical protein DRO52_05125 [Candidatus Hecatellales archaeon]|nr:MAG: hypothetical protein DRO52_05125 [Candidatus Hecatellales archaeon]